MTKKIIRTSRHVMRRRLMSTASALALVACACGGARASGDDADRPTLWIDLGVQLDHASGTGDNFPIGFMAANPNSTVLKPISPFQAQDLPPLGFGGEGKISFQPENSDWVFSAGVQFGRSGGKREVDHQTNKAHYWKYHNGVVPPSGMNVIGYNNFADTNVSHHEKHLILDFSAGKDVGLGSFGKDGSSVLSAGVRFAQFSSSETLDVRARPDLYTKYATNHTAFSFTLTKPLFHFHTYHLTGHASRSFHGVGPSLSWTGSAAIAGNTQNGEIVFDWGANAALLFGKQKMRTRHQESGHYQSTLAHFSHGTSATALVYQHSGERAAARSVTVPDVGGFAGISWRVEDFKVSLGYRADFFFGAVDGGIDARKSETLGFKGPYASVSLGLGD